MGWRALHERPWEFNQIGDTTNGYLSSPRSAMGIWCVYKIFEKGYKAAETANYVCRPLCRKLFEPLPTAKLPSYPYSRPEIQAWTIANAS